MSMYIIRAGYAGPVKIGKADCIPDRVRGLQTAHYEELRVSRVVHADAERQFHERFSHLRIRGEWFHFDEEMLSFEAPEARPEGDFEKTLAEYKRALGMEDA
jgi:hypothetical protein